MPRFVVSLATEPTNYLSELVDRPGFEQSVIGVAEFVVLMNAADLYS